MELVRTVIISIVVSYLVAKIGAKLTFREFEDEINKMRKDR